MEEFEVVKISIEKEVGGRNKGSLLKVPNVAELMMMDSKKERDR